MNDDPPSNGRAERSGLFDRLRNLFGAPQTSVREDIEEALSETSEGDLTAQERAMLRSVLGLHELRVRDVMVPRTDITAIEKSDSLGHVLQLFRTAGHSRLPVYDESLDAPQGMVHIRDFLELLAKLSAEAGTALRSKTPGKASAYAGETFGAIDLSKPIPVATVLRPVLFVPPSMPVLDLLVRMQAQRTHMALVIDEYGGTDGLVSIEDVVEVIVGDIEDEHDIDETPRIEAAADGSFAIDGRAAVEQAIAVTGVDFASGGEADDIDTVGGFVATVAGRVPEPGEVIALSGDWEFEIADADRRRVKSVTLRRKSAPTTPDASN
jgi:CBS domain containing-hemolysin-like protein